jgi:hypothetical protein
MAAVGARMLAIAIVAMLCALSPSMLLAQQQSSWNGTWVGGWETGQGIQIVFAGDELIAVYWRDDYVGDATSSASPDGTMLTIAWPAVQAFLTRDSRTAAHIIIHQMGQPDVAFSLKLDHS